MCSVSMSIDSAGEFLGSTSITSIDYSDYEGATITHDLNRPIPDQLRGVSMR
jgi:hypothetical protein